MKFGNLNLAELNYETVVIVRGGDGYSLKVAPPTFDFLDWFRAKCSKPYPVAPKRPARDSAGLILKNEDGSAIIEPVRSDPKFIKDMAEYNRLLYAAQIRDVLRCDEKVTWNATAPAATAAPQAWTEFFAKIATELQDSGLTEAELVTILKAADKASLGIKNGEGVVASAAERFLGESADPEPPENS